jgi:Zn-dependent peptidase ImmA (M78 family)/transcriptional regulator with XRE-family HTH domain
MRPGTPGFVGQRLREAREARELTAVALADLVGVTRQAVSQYENGLQTPAPEVMRRITEVVRLPYHFFLAPPRQEERDIIFYRSLASATKASRLRAERRYGWLRDVAHYLRAYVRLPAVEFPPCTFGEDPRFVTDADIENVAEESRRFWGLKDHSISNMVWLVENHGGLVGRIELGSEKLDAFSQWNREESTPYFVLGSDKESAARSRYNLAHELGHVLIHRNVSKDLFEDKPIFKAIEAQAHRFAGCFLLPESTFGAEFIRRPSLDHFCSLKSKWKVSIQLMIMRCADLRIISADDKTRLFASLSGRGWRRKEPLDGSLEPEEPSLLKRSFEVLVDRRMVSPRDVGFRLALDDTDIEELAGLERGFFRGSPGAPAAPADGPHEGGPGSDDLIPFPRPGS